MHRKMVSIRNIAPTTAAALIILSSLLFVATSALSTPSSGSILPRRTTTSNHHRIQNLACSVVPRAVESVIISSTATTSNNKRKRTRKKCNQLRRKQQQQQEQSSSSSYYKSHYNVRSNDNNDDDREDVDEWLIRSTALILGDNYNTVEENTTQQQPHEECILASSSSSSSSNVGLLPSQFNSLQEYLYHAQSVMKAWTHWNSRNTIGYRRDARWTVEVILKRVLYVIAATLEEGKMTTTATKTSTTTTTTATTTTTSATTTETTDISELRPTLVSLVNIIIDAWANGKTVDETAVRHVESWLDFLKRGELIMRKNEDQHDEEKDGEEKSSSLLVIGIGPNEESYRGVVKAYIRTQKRDYLEKALNLLEEMEMSGSSSSTSEDHPNGSTSEDHPPNNNVIYPTTLTYNLILYGLANAQPSTTKNAEIAENLLQKKMISSSLSGQGGEEDCDCCCCYPDSNSFRQVISAWTKTGSPDAITKSNTILNQMLNDFPKLDPDVSTFNAIMTLNLRLDKVEDVISMFHRMVSMRELGRIGTRPDIYSMNLLLKAMTSRRRRRRRRTQQHNDDPRQYLNEANDLLKAMEDTYHVHPDVQSFNIVIDAWSKSQLPEAVSRAEQLLDLMERKCRNDSLAARPDSYTFTSVFDSIARCSSSSEQHNSCFHRAEKIFHRIEKMHQDGIVVERPTIPVYNAYLNALVSSSQDLDALDRVESIFANMITERNANIRSYNTMLKAYAQFRSGRDGYFSRPLKAEELLTLMEERPGIPYPDSYSYTTVINSFARSIVDRKAKKARQILDKMIQSYSAGNTAAKPEIYAFNGVLSASAHTHHTRYPEERLEAFTILVSTFLLLREWTEPNDSTYTLFFQACERLLPKGHRLYEQVIETVVYSCIRDGQMSANVMRALRNTAPDLAQQFEKMDSIL